MHFEIFKGKSGEWYWRLVAANHKIIATGGEGYVNKADARHGIELVQGTTSKTPITEVD